MLQFKKMMPKASLEKSNTDELTFGVTSFKAKSAEVSAGEESLFLRNRILEQQIDRLYEQLAGKDQELALREEACKEKVYVIESAIAKIHTMQKEMDQKLQEHSHDLQQAHLTIQHFLNLLQEAQADQQALQNQLRTAHAERLRLLERIQILEREDQSGAIRQIRSQKASPSWENTAASFNDYPNDQEEITVSSPSPQTNHVPSSKSRPISLLGYATQQNPNFYMRGSQFRHPEVNVEESRMEMLEAKVETLTNDLSEIKKYLAEISKHLNHGSTPTDSKQDKAYSTVQTFAVG